MKSLFLSAALTVLMVLFVSTAHADCHQDLRDMLKGTLELANADDRRIQLPEQEEDGNCTLAAVPFYDSHEAVRSTIRPDSRSGARDA